MENLEIVKWAAGQSDRVWFLLAIGVIVYTFLKQQRRNEAQIDRLHAEAEERRKAQHEKNEEMQAQYLAHCTEFAVVVEKASEIMERLERKL